MKNEAAPPNAESPEIICNQPTPSKLPARSKVPQTQWTQKQKARYIVLHPVSQQTTLNPQIQTVAPRPITTIQSQIRPPEEAQSQTAAPGATASEGCEKVYQNSKSQSQSKRQRSALWVARANLLKMSMTNGSRKGSHNHFTSQHKDSVVKSLLSPKGVKVSNRAHQLFSHQQAHQQTRMLLSNSPGTFVFSKSKKHSFNLARRTIEKLLKKQGGESLGMFSKASSQPTNSQLGLNVGEVFSSLAKMTKSRAAQPLEAAAAHLIRASATQQAQTRSAKPRKKATGSNVKHAIASMVLHAQQQNCPSPMIALQSHKTHTVKGQSGIGTSGACLSVKASVPTVKNGRRTSQSRMEAFEASYAIAHPKRSSFQLPVHKLKKRLNQPPGNSSVQSLQASLFNGQTREIRPSTSQSKQQRATQGQSKSKSPLKKSSSRVVPKPKLMSKRNTRQHALPQSSLYDDREIMGKDSQTVAYFEELQAHPSIESAKRSHATSKRPKPFSLNSKVAIATARQNESNQVSVTAKDRRGGRTDTKRKYQHNFKTDQSNIKVQQSCLQQHVESNDDRDRQNDLDKEQQSEEDSLSEEQSVADEVLDPEAAMAVLRELGNLCLFQPVRGSSDEQVEEDLSSGRSHRSHEHFGCGKSPLVLSYSEHGSKVDRRALSEKEFESMRGESRGESVDSDGSEAGEREPLVAAIGQAQKQEQKQQQQFGRPEQGPPPSDPRHSSPHSRQRLTVPALEAHTLANLSVSRATGSSGSALAAKQTATDKNGECEVRDTTPDPLKNRRGRLLPPERKNRDVTCLAKPPQDPQTIDRHELAPDASSGSFAQSDLPGNHLLLGQQSHVYSADSFRNASNSAEDKGNTVCGDITGGACTS